MLKQEVKTEPSHRRTLREMERRRLLGNRLLGTGIALSLAIATITAVRRALPHWLEIPGNAAAINTSAQTASLSKAPAFPVSPSRHPNKVSLLPAATKKQDPIRKITPRSVVSSAVLGPEILPIEESEVPRRRRRRRRSTAKITEQSPATAAPSKHAEANAIPATRPEPAPKEPNSRPPDDVPDNP